MGHPLYFSPQIIVPVDQNQGEMTDELEEDIDFKSGNYHLELSYENLPILSTVDFQEPKNLRMHINKISEWFPLHLPIFKYFYRPGANEEDIEN